MGKPRDECGPATTLKDQGVLITGAGDGMGGAMIDVMLQHPRVSGSIHDDAPRNSLAAP